MRTLFIQKVPNKLYSKKKKHINKGKYLNHNTQIYNTKVDRRGEKLNCLV